MLEHRDKQRTVPAGTSLAVESRAQRPIANRPQDSILPHKAFWRVKLASDLPMQRNPTDPNGEDRKNAYSTLADFAHAVSISESRYGSLKASRAESLG